MVAPLVEKVDALLAMPAPAGARVDLASSCDDASRSDGRLR
jgi:hypothetical protein